MVDIEIKEFDDELRIMEELMENQEISLSNESLKVSLSTLHLKKAVVVELDTSIKECIETMLARGFGCLLVVRDGKYCGIFTERDVLLKIVGQDVDYNNASVEEFMSPDPLTLRITDTVEKVLRLMVERGYRHICIENEGGRPMSVISIRDIIGFIVEFFPQDVLNLPPHPIRVGTRNRHGA